MALVTGHTACRMSSASVDVMGWNGKRRGIAGLTVTYDASSGPVVPTTEKLIAPKRQTPSGSRLLWQLPDDPKTLRAIARVRSESDAGGAASLARVVEP
jgi:hypothetical protein